MTFLCSDCANEFDGNEYTEKCPFCGAEKDAFVMQPLTVMSECESHLNINND